MIPSLSFEFFPPKTDEDMARAWDSVHALTAFHPAFLTITYNAAPQNRRRTVDMAIVAAGRTALPLGAHLTCLTTPASDLMDMADTLWQHGIRHIVALRGDRPKDPAYKPDPGQVYFPRTDDFVRALKKKHDFKITVGGYPEVHPEATDAAADLRFLKQKCDAGADQVITQFFFDNISFYRFRDRAAVGGIHVPILPGLMPFSDFDRVLRFADIGRAHIPASSMTRLSAARHDPALYRAVSADLLYEQMSDLAAHGTHHVHFYTLNRADLIAGVLHRLGAT